MRERYRVEEINKEGDKDREWENNKEWDKEIEMERIKSMREINR